MTAPSQAIQSGNDRFYPRNFKHYVSVTTVLGDTLPKDGLVQWAANAAADYALGLLAEGTLATGHRLPDLRNLIRYAWVEQRDAAGRLGDAVHEHAEFLMRSLTSDGVLPWGKLPLLSEQDYLDSIEDRKLRNRVRSLLRWIAAHEIIPLHIEATVYEDETLYAGSCDLMAVIDGVVTILDFKSSKSIFSTVALQLAAYSWADYILTDSGKELKLPRFERAAVLHIRDRGYVFREVDAGYDNWLHFKRLVETKRLWINGASEKALKGIIEPAKAA